MAWIPGNNHIGTYSFVSASTIVSTTRFGSSNKLNIASFGTKRSEVYWDLISSGIELNVFKVSAVFDVTIGVLNKLQF